jgi:hypothetical protein
MSDQVVGFIAGFVIGIVTSLLANLIWSKRFRIRTYFNHLIPPRFDVLDFDPASVGLHPINRWTTARPLTRQNLEMTVSSNRPKQTWLNDEELTLLAESFRRQHKSGDTGYLVDYEIDHHESRRGQVFRYTVTHCKYWEYLATCQYLQDHPQARSKIWETFESGHTLAFARTAPPSSVKINVSITSPEGNALIVQRSGAVDLKKGLWTVGPNETMILRQFPTPGTQMEDFFGLAERCLREELALEPADYGPINISWLGYDVNTAQVKVYAQARSHLPQRELEHRMADAHGLYEVQSRAWLPLNRQTMADVIQNWEKGDSKGRHWSASAPHALQELWRFRKALMLGEGIS